MYDTINIHQAYKTGDLKALKSALGNPPDFPNCVGPGGLGGNCLEYAIYHSPLTFIRTLLELGADPNYLDDAGFPSIIAALSSQRTDRCRIIELLLSFGADIQRRGINDHTPLHYVASTEDIEAMELLLLRGADPGARTSIDHYATPLEEAEYLGRAKAVQALRRLVPGL